METEALAPPEVLRRLLDIEPPDDLLDKVMARIAKLKKGREYESHRKPSKEALRESRRKWNQEHPQRSKEYAVKRQFSMSLEEYETQLAKQNNRCALCGLEFYGEGGGRPVLDHNHVNGGLRDFLHSSCNMALGMFNDDPATCRQAAEYLERHGG